jgi:SAM-dependent methyltransferase
MRCTTIPCICPSPVGSDSGLSNSFRFWKIYSEPNRRSLVKRGVIFQLSAHAPTVVSHSPCERSLFSLDAFATRLQTEERMDDFSITDERLRAALDDIRWINRLLGGYRATNRVLDPVFRSRSSLRVLDVGTGSGDYPARLARRGRRMGTSVEAVGVDLNPATVGYGRAWIDAHLSADLRPHVHLEVADALNLPYPDDAFDVTHAALFLHHFHGDNAVELLREMARVSRLGIVVNDLHRHPLAYAGIWALSRLLRMAPMVQHDGPISVQRGFWRSDLRTLAEKARLPSPSIRWHWAFRWTLDTLSEAE